MRKGDGKTLKIQVIINKNMKHNDSNYPYSQIEQVDF